MAGVNSAFCWGGETVSGPWLPANLPWPSTRLGEDGVLAWAYLPRAENAVVADFFKYTNLLINGEKFMSAKPLAEVYEKLKELRRQGEPNFEIRAKIGHQLRSMYDDVVTGVPGRFAELVRRLDKPEDVAGKSDQAASLVRILEIKTLADRVFSDEEKAEAWLHRPNASLSGQRPADLLEDELGAAVVREMLERIDHGIFA
jgi:putative toxin-antitoxin system antitoxin component (TIGR02293 family)